MARFVGERALVPLAQLSVAPRLIIGIISKPTLIKRSIDLGRNIITPRPSRTAATIDVRFLALANDSDNLGYQSLGEEWFQLGLDLESVVARLS